MPLPLAGLVQWTPGGAGAHEVLMSFLGERLLVGRPQHSVLCCASQAAFGSKISSPAAIATDDFPLINCPVL